MMPIFVIVIICCLIGIGIWFALKDDFGDYDDTGNDTSGYTG